ncbi:hypothetical protein MCOR21_000598 [Pyricularia oryzae]|nr:hypothetical protein MCOR34_005531 [Pyricularia oryzae]KAI6331211.1 hypothetical protein MCOR30_004905 [Pyricularia oryzae]KAI6381261.1 hypothetical protein MCOR32_003590 [Pyricularia oryzae]KAI6437355.1 hypothetical protein MCOR21_000598 [Pyricularia oryzae]KAI6438316.1 hypothetical protein MCOR24_000235 [Pyricularia oryzae]
MANPLLEKHAITSDRAHTFTHTLMKQVVTVSDLQNNPDHIEFSERKVWQLHDGSNFGIHLRKLDRLIRKGKGMQVKILEMYGVLVDDCDNDWAAGHNRHVDEMWDGSRSYSQTIKTTAKKAKTITDTKTTRALEVVGGVD